MAKLTQARAESLLAGRFQAACDRAIPDAICGDHEWQKRVLTSTCRNIIAICSRRAGKSELAVGLALRTAMRTGGTSNLYLGLTKESSGIVWRKFKRLAKRLKFPVTLLESDQVAILPNLSRILFTGTDDIRRISHLLGDQLSCGIAILDECQSDPGLLRTVAEDVLGPMLYETTVDLPEPGRLVMLGTVPDVPAGYFWDTWVRNFTGPGDICPAYSESDMWGCYAWSRFQNPFERHNEQRLSEYLDTFKYERSDPEVLRRWQGLRVFSKDSNAYRFQPAKHTYTPPYSPESMDLGPFRCSFSPVLPGVRHYIVGIDQAQRRDRFAVICWGWNPDDKDHVWHMAEAVTGFGADPQDSEWLAVCKELKRRYGGSMEFIRDAGGSSAPVNDALQLSHGISIVSALKGPGSLKARVQRLADLLNKGVAKVMVDSELAMDLLTAKWSMAAREKGKWELDKTAKSPDLADAATYAFDLPSYTQIGYRPDKKLPLTEADWLRQQRDKTLRDLMSGRAQAKPRPNPSLIMWQPPR